MEPVSTDISVRRMLFGKSAKKKKQTNKFAFKSRKSNENSSQGTPIEFAPFTSTMPNSRHRRPPGSSLVYLARWAVCCFMLAFFSNEKHSSLLFTVCPSVRQCEHIRAESETTGRSLFCLFFVRYLPATVGTVFTGQRRAYSLKRTDGDGGGFGALEMPNH